MTDRRIRIRAVDCGNGDDCPALDHRAGGGIEVTGTPVHRPDIPGHEAVVLVPDSLLPEIAALDVPDLGTFIADRHRTDLLRVQTLDYYGVASDGDDVERYLRGEREPTAPGKQEWLAELRAATTAGRIRRNVHVVRTPLTDYLRYQFEWCYTANSAAGQDIRIVDIARTPAVEPLLALGDYTVIEHTVVVRSRYARDGSRQGAVQVSADGAASFAALAETAWRLGTPFTEWWDAHPQYHRAARAA